MALDVVAVETFTQGRLLRDDEETQRQLDAALAAVRNYCGWHVTPVLTNAEITVDGPGGPLLTLPTLNLTALTSVVEDGIELDTTALAFSARGMVAKKRAQLVPLSYAHYRAMPWNFWTDCFQGITVTMTHGFGSVPDFEAVVLAAIERGGFAAGSDAEVKVIGPFQYETAGMTGGTIFTSAELAVLDRYRLERIP